VGVSIEGQNGQMPLGGTSSYRVGPLVLVAVVIVMVLVSRWVWSPNKTIKRRDYGLLVPALAVVDLEQARAARSRLLTSGIRATLGQAPPVVLVSAEGRAVRQPALHQVLVFPADLARAQDVLQA
jgi:hypothetical protein